MDPFADPDFGSLLLQAFVADDPDARAKARETENVRLVERLYALLGQGALPDEVFSDDVRFDIHGVPGVPMVGRHQGREAVLAAAAANFGLLEDQRPVVKAVVAQGDLVVVFLHETGRFRATGRPYEIAVVQQFTVRDGQIAHVRQLSDNAGLLEASGQWERTG